ncbi:putative kinase suppressor of Ras 2-like, partial [Scophthalmus maximus]
RRFLVRIPVRTNQGPFWLQPPILILRSNFITASYETVAVNGEMFSSETFQISRFKDWDDSVTPSHYLPPLLGSRGDAPQCILDGGRHMKDPLIRAEIEPAVEAPWRHRNHIIFDTLASPVLLARGPGFASRADVNVPQKGRERSLADVTQPAMRADGGGWAEEGERGSLASCHRRPRCGCQSTSRVSETKQKPDDNTKNNKNIAISLAHIKTRSQIRFWEKTALTKTRLSKNMKGDMIENNNKRTTFKIGHRKAFLYNQIFVPRWCKKQRLTRIQGFSSLACSRTETNPLLQIEVETTSDNEEGNDEDSGDEFEEMNLSLLSARNFPRKASQTSIFLQEWDIPIEQLEIGEMIGKGRFGKVFHGRWHGEVAIRLIDIERDNEDQLKAFKREVMAYRNTRHENVVLFMGACMSPPHLAIITSLCKGRTLYSVVRDAKVVLDVNKTRQIAQEMVKGMGYLHAKGILHKDMKSKNVFYDNGKVVITDFGLFTISGVLQAGSRREDKLRIPNGWLCHLAPEIIQQLSPDTEEDKLPFSKQSDVFAFGTIWYELHAREWPYKSQPAEVIIWQIGSGMKPNLAQTGMGKEISDILLLCWAFKQDERPSFSKLVDLLEKLPKRNRRLSHPGHFWKSAEYVK